MNLKRVTIWCVVYFVSLCGVLWFLQFFKPIQTTFIRPRIFFTLWQEQAVDNHFVIKEIVRHLVTKEYGNYEILKRGPRYYERCVNKQDLHLIAWKHFPLPIECMKEQTFLWQLESPISITVPPSDIYKNRFHKIFTYHQSSTNGQNVIYTPIPYTYHRILKNYDLKSKQYLVSLVGKYSEYHHYRLRRDSIVWFLKNHPNDIRFFGHDWQNILKYLSDAEQEKFKIQYGGYISDKFEEISKSKFVLAYENFRFNDYITEKIYDVMAAGSVPIYSGAPNIREHIPQSCFIDFHAFQSYEELYDFLVNMSDDTYNDYLDCIKDFMAEPESHSNHYKNVAQIILYHMTE